MSLLRSACAGAGSNRHPSFAAGKKPQLGLRAVACAAPFGGQILPGHNQGRSASWQRNCRVAFSRLPALRRC